MKKIIFLLFIPLLISACHSASKTKPKSDESSACLKSKINAFSKTDCDKHPNVKEYTFQGKQVFVFDPGKCGADMTSEVMDKECKNLGYLGGFAGNVKINGEDFSNAVFVKTIWER